MVVQHNLSSMNANRQLGITVGNPAKSSEKLSSGYKINRAADDAAGLAISEKMRRQIRGLTQASLNAQDGVSLVQVADGAMAEVHDMMQRGNELAVKAANDTLTPEDREYIQSEIDAIIEEIDAINGKTTFNEKYVLKGSSTGGADFGVQIQKGTKLPAWVGTEGTDGKYMNGSYSDGTTNYPVATRLDFSSFDGSDAKKDELDGTGFYFTCKTCDNHYSIQFVNGPVSGSQPETSGQHFIYSVDISGATSADDIINSIITATGGKPNNHYTQLANENNGKLVIYDNRTSVHPGGSSGYFGKGVAKQSSQAQDAEADIILQVGSETESPNQIKLEMPYISSKTCMVEDVSVLSHREALDAIESFKNGLTFISTERSRMGAYQNRLEHTIKNLDNVVENTQAAESRVRDTDMASEMVKYSNNNILAQAGQSMLAQANQTNQGVLTLLQ